MAFFEWLETLSFSMWVRESGSLWAFPMFLFSHTLGMAMVAGGATLISMALLGMWPKAPIKPMEKFYPVIAGQHYKYLLRQMTEIRDGKRRNANPDMVKIIKKYDNQQLVAISAYQSSLVMPGSMCKPKTAAAPAPAKKK